MSKQSLRVVVMGTLITEQPISEIEQLNTFLTKPEERADAKMKIITPIINELKREMKKQGIAASCIYLMAQSKINTMTFNINENEQK